jgi:anti-sigma B factor antagonist
METCRILNERLAEAGQQAETALAIDLSGLDFICSLGLGAIVAAYLRARRAGIGIRLVAPRPEIRDLLTLTKLETLLPVFDSISSSPSGLGPR